MIPIDPSGTQRHMAMMQMRELAPTATVKMEMAEKPKMGPNTQQGVGKLDAQATRSAGDCAALQKAHDMALQERARRLTEAHHTAEQRIQDLTQAHDASVEERIRDLTQAHDGGCMPQPGGHPGHEEGPALDRFFQFGAKVGGVVSQHGAAFLRNNIDPGVQAMETTGHQDAIAERSTGSRLEATAIQRHGEFAAQ